METEHGDSVAVALAQVHVEDTGDKDGLSILSSDNKRLNDETTPAAKTVVPPALMAKEL